MLLARHKRKGFLHRIITGDEKWIHYTHIIQRRGNGDLVILEQPSRIFMEKNSCCVFGGISLYYELLKPNETITGALYRTQLMRLSRTFKERAHYYSRHDKIILLHDNARPHVAAPVKISLETLKWEIYPTRRILQTLLFPTITCSNR